MSTLMKRNSRLFPSIPSLFDDFLTRDLFDWNNRSTDSGLLPAINIKETKDSFDLEVAAPGLNKNDFKVELDNNVLNISAEKAENNEVQEKEGDYTRREFNYQSFVRSFSLPQGMVDGEKINAKYNDGILYISIPKTENAKEKPAKKIKIS